MPIDSGLIQFGSEPAKRKKPQRVKWITTGIRFEFTMWLPKRLCKPLSPRSRKGPPTEGTETNGGNASDPSVARLIRTGGGPESAPTNGGAE